MAAAMAELTRQNQELRKEVNLRRQTHQEQDEEGPTQDQEGRENFHRGSPSRDTTSRRASDLKREMDQMKKAMDEMKENMRRVNPVEDLVHRTDSPFTASINGHPLPPKFKMPSLDSYDGNRDPFDHIATFKTTMHLQGVPDEIMCRAFPTTLKGPARVWFSKLPRIREALTVDEVDDKLLLAAFHNGVNSDLFIHKLYEKEPQSMAELVHSAQNFMNAEDAIIAKKRKRAERVESNPSRQSDQGPRPKKGRTEDKKDREKRAGPSTRNQHYTPLSVPLEQAREVENFLGRDHRDEKLKAKVEEPSRPPLGEIRIILGGSSAGQSSKSKKAYLKAVQSVQLSGRSPNAGTMDEQAITFTDEDAKKVHHPHDDAIVITLLIADYKTRRVLIDNGSSADILYFPAFQQMRLGRENLKKYNFPFCIIRESIIY
ncbi:uncharacterized protein LOC111985009 [Quercus suber]|uniref:uncharacterized protein LOC111985009 n=1 Tax=Quercus suber TaxID=58331 RepID=UPI0032DEF318